MCDWNPKDLLDDWRGRSLADLRHLGDVDFRASKDGSKATFRLKGGAVLASITAWSTGMLELTWSATREAAARDPEVLTEQRDARGHADALLDRWLARLKGETWPDPLDASALYAVTGTGYPRD